MNSKAARREARLQDKGAVGGDIVHPVNRGKVRRAAQSLRLFADEA